MRKGKLYAGGLGLNFFNSPEFEKENNATPEENSVIIACNALRILMMGWRDNWQDIASWRVLNAIFVERDHELVKGMRLAFQQGFDHVFAQLKDQEFTKKQQNQAQLFISNCISLLPFADPNPYESFTIPQLINNSWQMVEYKVTPIELTPTKGFSKLFIEDNDRVFAYGLEPLINTEAESHLVFMGTTYPAGQGFNTQVNTDLEALATPGNFLYQNGRDKIIQWIDKQPKKPHVCGTSLGGALSLLLAIDQGNRLSRVDALNPPGLFEAWCGDFAFDHWEKFNEAERPQVYVQKQHNDPVSKFGVWKKEWHILHVEPAKSNQGPNQFIDHALNYAGFADTQFVGVDTTEDNEERKKRNFWIYSLLRSLGYYFAHQPYRLVVLPIFRFVLNHKLVTALTILFVLGSIFLTPLLPTVAAAAAFITIGLIPLTIYFAYKLYSAVQTVLGWNEVKPPPCHDPNLPRNESLDMYANRIIANLTSDEIKDYYEAKRCRLGDATFQPKTREKREMLSRCQDEPLSNLQVNRTKAKIKDMKQAIQLFRVFQLQNTEDSAHLKTALQAQHEAYAIGKV